MSEKDYADTNLNATGILGHIVSMKKANRDRKPIYLKKALDLFRASSFSTQLYILGTNKVTGNKEVKKFVDVFLERWFNRNTPDPAYSGYHDYMNKFFTKDTNPYVVNCIIKSCLAHRIDPADVVVIENTVTTNANRWESLLRDMMYRCLQTADRRSPIFEKWLQEQTAIVHKNRNSKNAGDFRKRWKWVFGMIVQSYFKIKAARNFIDSMIKKYPCTPAVYDFYRDCCQTEMRCKMFKSWFNKRPIEDKVWYCRGISRNWPEIEKALLQSRNILAIAIYSDNPYGFDDRDAYENFLLTRTFNDVKDYTENEAYAYIAMGFHLDNKEKEFRSHVIGLMSQDPNTAVALKTLLYIRHCGSGTERPYYVLESTIVEKGEAPILSEYAVYVRKKRWSAAIEDRILEDKIASLRYSLAFFNKPWDWPKFNDKYGKECEDRSIYTRELLALEGNRRQRKREGDELAAKRNMMLGYNSHPCMGSIGFLEPSPDIMKASIDADASLEKVVNDPALMEDVNAVLVDLGLDVETAVRIFLKRIIAENGLPFTMKKGNDR